MASLNKIAWTYTDDKGDDYRVAATKAITDQQNGSLAPKVGGSAAAASVKRLPPHIKPRYAYFKYGTVQRKVICYEADCDAYALDGTTLTLDTSGASQTFTKTAEGSRGERRRDTCTQSA